MAQSDTSMCNAALLDIGQPGISALTDPNKAARLCKQLFAVERDALLREFDWNCARDQAVLAASADAPLFGGGNTFPLPANCLAMRGTDHDDCDPERFEWEVRGRTVVTCLGAPLNIYFTKTLTDTAQMDALFCAALSKRIGRALAMPLANSVALKSQMNNEYLAAISTARGASFREVARRDETTSWLRARR